MMNGLIKAAVCCGMVSWTAAGLGAQPAASTMGKATGVSATELFADKLVARGKGIEIKQSQVDKSFTEFKASLAAQGQSIPEAKRSEVERQVLERLVHVRLLTAKATEADKTKARESAEKVLADYRKRWPSEESFNRQLVALGMAPGEFRARMEEEAIFREVIDREVKSGIKPTAEQAKKFYEENGAQFDFPERIHASHILILTQDSTTQQPYDEAKKAEKQKFAEKVLQRAKAGEDFGQLAKEYSDDPNSRDRGGDLGAFARGRMVQEFDTAAFALSAGQLSGLVSTKFGFHIIKVLEKLPAQKKSFAEAEKDINEYLATVEAQKQLPDYLKKLREDAGVVFLDK